jgi:hypothetical protein
MDDAMLLEVNRDRRTGRGRWWGPGGCDYTDLLGRAGLYTPERAAQLTAHSDRTTARPLADVVEEVFGDGEWMAHRGLGLDRVVVPGTVGELLAGLDIPGQIRRAVVGRLDPRDALYDAVRYLLDRAQENPDLGYLVGPGTEAFRLLCAAEAAYTGRPVEQVERERGEDLQPEHRRRPARVVELEEEVEQLRGLVYPAQCAVRDQRKGWDPTQALLDLGQALEDAGRAPGSGDDAED